MGKDILLYRVSDNNEYYKNLIEEFKNHNIYEINCVGTEGTRKGRKGQVLKINYDFENYNKPVILAMKKKSTGIWTYGILLEPFKKYFQNNLKAFYLTQNVKNKRKKQSSR